MLIINHHLQLIKDTTLQPEDIIDFVDSIKSENLESINYHRKNFENFIKRCCDINYIMVFHDDKKITGVCAWCCLSCEDSLNLNKAKWEFPEDIVSGNVLYVALCAIAKDCKMTIWQVKDLFEKLGYREKVDQVLWYYKYWYRKDMAKCR